MSNYTGYDAALRMLARGYNEDPGMQQMLDIAEILVNVARGCEMEQPATHHEALAHQLGRLLERAKALRTLEAPVRSGTPIVTPSALDAEAVARDIRTSVCEALETIDVGGPSDVAAACLRLYPSFSAVTFEPPAPVEPSNARLAGFEVRVLNGRSYYVSVEELP